MHCAGDPIASLGNITEKPAPWVANLRFPDACAMAISPFLAQLVNLKPGYRAARAVHFLGSVETSAWKRVLTLGLPTTGRLR